MPVADQRGLAMTGIAASDVGQFEEVLDKVLSFHGDPVSIIDRLLEANPGFILGHCLAGYVFAFSLHPGLVAKAQSCRARAVSLAGGANERERAHLAALTAWIDGDNQAARTSFDRLTRSWPLDLMALMFAHQADFFGSGGQALLERPSRALNDWTADLAGYGYVLGMRAFGLEEAGRYGEAEEAGREAVALNRLDAWSVHAVGHVHEMQGRDDEGVAWYRERQHDWSEDCVFAVHNWWHLALYHVDRDDPDGALQAYDDGIAPTRRSITLNLCDAAALLWRLHLADIDVGDRWQLLAPLFERHAHAGLHLFNDVHAMLAFVGAGRLDDATRLNDTMQQNAHGYGAYAETLRRAGLAAGRAILAFGRRDYAQTVSELVSIETTRHLMAGSLAQRDVLTMLLIEAAIRAGRQNTARRLLQARLDAKPASARIARDLARCRP